MSVSVVAAAEGTEPASQPALLLLHGLGAHAGVWTPFMDAVRRTWPGRILAPDLPGHGRAPWAANYAMGCQAAAVATILSPGDRVSVVGHSMGGLVAIALASRWFGVAVERVFALGVKVAWTDEERRAAAAQAERPVRWFDHRAEAADRFLKVSGLAGLAAAADMADRGIVAEVDRWRLAADPRTPSVGGPDVAGLLAAAACPVRFARGVADPLVSADALRRLDPGFVELAGGHNAHVEQPVALARLVADWAAR